MKVVLEAVQGDITRADTEAIVNAANNEFWMGSGVAGAIKAKGGDVIEKEATGQGSVMPGQVIYTGAGRLRFKYVIHAAVMGQDLRTTDRLIRQSTIGCLNLADKLGLSSVALPAFGTGVGRFPVRACANIMITAANGWSNLAVALKRIQFCLLDEVAYAMFVRAIGRLEAD